jgi:hypothetical protein
VIVNEYEAPEHNAGEEVVGIYVIVETIGEVVLLVAVKLGIFPDPLAASPIAVFEFVQVKFAPMGLLTKEGTEITFPLQSVIFEIAVAVGLGLIVIVKE